MLASYLMSDNDGRSSIVKRVKKKRRDRDDGYHGTAFLPMYLHDNNSRAYNAYTSGKSASRINVSGGKISTRANAFRGVSSVARSASYSGG